ncbi:squalene/phytoene synthase family protein [bacterium]|nr:squalene/phytoene synthase family protein [bacterium]
MIEASEKELREAYAHCIESTKQAARNFYYGIRLLRRERFASLCALYAFCRELDDAADNPTPHEALFARRRRLVDGQAIENPDKTELAFSDTMMKYRLPKAVLEQLIDTIEADLKAPSFETMDDVVGYARGVASTVGLCSVRIFGVDDGSADDFADALGIALQWTNILRDIEEDFQRGRCYLPQQELREFDLTVENLVSENKEASLLWWKEALDKGCHFFQMAGKAFPHQHRSKLSPALAMAAVYRRLLDAMARNPLTKPSLSRSAKLTAVFATLTGLWDPFR